MNTKNSQNQIGRRFSKVFEKLMDPGYYEGTKYASYFSELNSDGTSKIYVMDSYEDELLSFVNSSTNQIKYLVGLTGMGKTSLLRNTFKIKNRDIKINNKRIIIYISFYNSNLISDNPDKSVENEILKYLKRTIMLLMENPNIKKMSQDNFWIQFYDFVENNKPTLLTNEDILPGLDFYNKDMSLSDYKKQELKVFFDKDPLEYYTSLLKYLITLFNTNTEIILIYDDIESKIELFHKPVVEIARHVQACLCATEGSIIKVKSLIALRAYTFRCNIGRQLEARRESIIKDVLLKESPVSLVDIFEKRFDYIVQHESIQKTDSHKQAKSELDYVTNHINRIGKDLIYRIANYNICEAMIIFCNVMTNLEWIAYGESETQGAFKIESKNYKVTTDNIINAIASISQNAIDGTYSYLPNIFYNEKDGTELIGLYIIRLLINRRIDQIYGEKYIEGKEIVSEIKSIFVKNVDSSIRTEYWTSKINNVISYLYNSGILFRSVYDIEIPDESQIERRFNDSYKLYLSPRGSCIYQTLNKNASMLKLYINDIFQSDETGTTNNKSTTRLFNKILDYVDNIFHLEQRYIGNSIPDLDVYQEKIGSEFISSTLLTGIVIILIVYYKEYNDEDFMLFLEKAKKIYIEMKDYSKTLNEKYGIVFTISKTLVNQFEKKRS